jgi:hypothetical protein
MKTTFTTVFAFIALVLATNLASAQTSRFPILPTSVWRINYEFNCPGEEFTHQNEDQEYKYFVDGDTLINGRSYFKLFKTGILYLDQPIYIDHKYMGAIRDSANQFFWVEAKLPTERLLYNFDAKVGDPICAECDGFSYTIGSIDTLDNGRKRFIVDVFTVHCGSANTIIEGIGWLGGLLEGNACYSHPGIRGSYLLCYSENDMPVYTTELSPRCGMKMSCNKDITAVELQKIAQVAEVTILRNKSIEICVPDGSIDWFDVEIFTLQGRKVNQQLINLPATIDASALGRGSYLLRLRNNQTEQSLKFVIQ